MRVGIITMIVGFVKQMPAFFLVSLIATWKFRVWLYSCCKVMLSPVITDIKGRKNSLIKMDLLSPIWIDLWDVIFVIDGFSLFPALCHDSTLLPNLPANQPTRNGRTIWQRTLDRTPTEIVMVSSAQRSEIIILIGIPHHGMTLPFSPAT